MVTNDQIKKLKKKEGALLKKLIISNHLTAYKIAKKCQVNEKTINDAVAGRNFLSQSTRYKIATLLKMELPFPRVKVKV